MDIPEDITLNTGDFFCVFVNTTPASGAACYKSGSTAGRFYSYIGNTTRSPQSPTNSYSIQMNLGYDPRINNE